jgi:hypothetical protein
MPARDENTLHLRDPRDIRALVEPAAARSDGRERPWRAPDRRRTVDIDTSTPAGAAAATAVALAVVDRSLAAANEFMATAHEEPEEWQNATSLSAPDLWLTVEETEKVTAAFSAALEPYRNRTLADRPDESRRVRITTMVVPRRRR